MTVAVEIHIFIYFNAYIFCYFEIIFAPEKKVLIFQLAWKVYKAKRIIFSILTDTYLFCRIF